MLLQKLKRLYPYVRHFLLFLFGLSVLFGIYYKYNAAYHVDEYYEMRSMRELTLDETFTIRIKHPLAEQPLKSFVEHYSICQQVHEILIISPSDASTDVDFKFFHSHSKVAFVPEGSESISTIATQGVMLLDVDIIVSCEDLKFTFNVWRSSRDALVGYFPRMHGKGDASGSRQLSYLDSSYVWWYQQYSIMLSSAVVLSTQAYQNYAFMKDPELSTEIKYIIKKHPICESLILSLFASANSAPPPIWVDVPYRIISTAPKKLESDHLEDLQNINEVRSSCLNDYYKLLKHPKLEYSYHKAAIAKNVLFW